MNGEARTALLVCEELPLPNFAGHTTYNRAFVHALTEAGFKVSVFVTGHRFSKPFFSPSEEVRIPGIRTIAPHAFNPFGDYFCIGPRSFLRWMFHQSGLKGMLRKGANGESKRVQIGKWLSDKRIKTSLRDVINTEKPDYLLIDTIFRSTILDEIPQHTTKILIGHDVFHQRCAALVGSGLSPAPNVSHADEAQALTRFDGVVAITENDAQAYRGMHPQLPALDLPSPISVRPSPPPRPDNKHVLYVGSRAQVNVDGLNWFLRDIWPKVREACPEARLDIVGSICGEIGKDTPGVILHGRVDDLAEISDQAMFAINPVRAGSGLKIKMLDYFAQGLGCLTTPAGATGFPDSDCSPIEICTTESEFSQACLRWLNAVDLCQRQSTYASAYARRFSFESFSEKLLNWVGSFRTPAVRRAS